MKATPAASQDQDGQQVQPAVPEITFKNAQYDNSNHVDLQ